MLFTGIFHLPIWGLCLVTLVLTHITIASVTIFLHRHQSHKALELHSIPSHFFRFWLWMTTGMVTKEWVAVHRKHHSKCETHEDPHSPKVYGLFRVLFLGTFLYVKERNKVETLEKYGHGTPNDWLERHLYSTLNAYGVVTMFVIDVVCFGLVPGAIMWGVQMIWIPFWAAGVINGIGHWWGYRPHKQLRDISRNILPWGILIGGEELHNNHHANPTSPTMRHKWYEFDIGGFYIWVLRLCRLARV
jgi:stearoyl-CoA desaturase (delta-9 desaturase)